MIKGSLAGAALIVTGSDGFTVRAQYALGYASALLCALIYPVRKRRFVARLAAALALAALACTLLHSVTHVSRIEIAFLQQVEEEDFMYAGHNALYVTAATPAALLEAMDFHQPPPELHKWLDRH